VSYQDFDDDKPEESFLKRNRVAIIGGIAVLVIVGTAIPLLIRYAKVPPPHKPEEIVIHLQPPPPLPLPPPPPPLPPPPPQPKMVEQPPVLKPEEKPKNEPKTPDKPPGPPAPVASGPPSDFGVGGPGGSGGNGTDGGGGSRWGWFAGQVQARIADALRKNDKTKDAKLRVKVRIWSDPAGRITRAELSGSSGDSGIDNAIKNEVLVGLQLQEPPPADMPMPIVLRLTEQRTN